MSANATSLGTAGPMPYALPADALEGLLRLAAHVALTEAAVAFLQQEDRVWVLASSGVESGAAHAAALILPDVLPADQDELIFLDVADAGSAAGLMGAALVEEPGFLYLVRFAVQEPGYRGVLCVAHSVARPALADEIRALVKEVVRQITLRMEGRANKRDLEQLKEWRESAESYLLTLGKANALGECLVNAQGTIVSASDGLLSSLKLRDAELRGSAFARIFAFDAAIQEAISGDCPWDRLHQTACFYHSEDGELQRLSASAVRVLQEGEQLWCVSIARAEDARAPQLLTNRRSRRVLVAEDHPVNQRVIQGMVEKLGLEADIVSTGLEAVHAVCQTQYAAILMDCQMPDMDGIEATRFIRSNEEGIGRIPIVAVTAFGHEEDRRRCLEAGVDEFMVKPIRMENLADALRRLTHLDVASAEPDEAAAPSLAQEIEQALARLRADLDADLVLEVVNLFLEDTSSRLEDIARCIQQERREEVRNLAHKIKGSCGSLGARTLMLDCEQLESLALRAPWVQIAESAQAVRRSFEAIAPRLRAYLGLPAML